MLSRLGGVVVMGRSAHRAIAGSEWVCRARFEGFVLQYVRCTVGFSSPEQGCEEAAFRVEQASEQPVRAAVFEPLLGPAAGEPDVEVAELVEHSGAVEQRAAVDCIQLASSDVERGSAGVRVEARTVLGNEVAASSTPQANNFSASSNVWAIVTERLSRSSSPCVCRSVK